MVLNQNKYIVVDVGGMGFTGDQRFPELSLKSLFKRFGLEQAPTDEVTPFPSEPPQETNNLQQTIYLQ